ncbi:hypothetical protein ACFWAT_23610 [Streptomyces syringium]|uniref:hypothetical protein n=1 Tax=Streptomyces syringium TaxID=76729 RepID=UPI003649FF3D
MSARHAAPDRDRFGTVLTASWAVLYLLGFGTLGLAVYGERATVADHGATPVESVPDSEPAPA